MAVLPGRIQLHLLLLTLISWSKASPAPQFVPDLDDITVNCGGENGAPLMTPCKSSIILDYQTTTSLKCEADEPMSWWTAQTSIVLDESSFDNTEDPERPYGTNLQLSGVTAEDVGAYYCVKDSELNNLPEKNEQAMIGLVNQGGASSIYVYVDDKENKLFTTETILQAMQYEDLVIPCKPAMPDTEVLLEFRGEVLSSTSVGRYDPQRGFTIEVRSITDGGDYICRPNPPFPDNEDEFSIIPVRFIGNGHIDKSGLEIPRTQTPPSGPTTNTAYTYAPDVTDYDDEVMVTVLTVTNQSPGSVALTSGGGAFTRDRARRSPARLAPMNASPSPRPGQAGKALPKPVIKSSSGSHVILGSNFTLMCEQTSPFGATYNIEWRTQDRSKVFPNDRIIITPAMFDHMAKNSTHLLGRSTLTVLDAQRSDSDLYKCLVTDAKNAVQHISYRIRVLGQNESYLNVYEPSGHYNVMEFANKTIQMTANFEGFPQPEFRWFKPDGTEVRQSENNFKIESTERSTTLRLLSAQLQDSGTYVLQGSNNFKTVQREYNVSVMDGPVLSMADTYVQVGSVARLECTVLSYPPALVTFLFRPCVLEPFWPTCSVLEANFSFLKIPRPGKLSVERIIEVSFRPTEPGILSCVAENVVGGESKRAITKAHVLLGNISENMTIYGFDKGHKIAKEDNVNCTCEALAYHLDGNLSWLHNGEALEESDNVRIETNRTEYSYKSTVHITSISDQDRGTYECRAYHIRKPSEYSTHEIDLNVYDPSAPQWVNPTQDAHKKIKRNLSQTLELECASTAVPLATVQWFKDDKELTESKLMHFLENNSKLIITHLYPGDEGVYRCLVQNRLASIERSYTLDISDLPGINLAWVWISAIIFLILISLSVFLGIRYKIEQKKNRELEATGFYNFKEGAPERINKDLPLATQALNLPYDENFEFPAEKLKLGKLLGDGAFGEVYKGEAKGILAGEPSTVVAVKTVKGSDPQSVKALVSELKIMIHLGKHLNVVNLLGACTKNNIARDIKVIVEYCHYGNVQRFLLKNRSRFINQIDPETDRIDPSIMTQRNSDQIYLQSNQNGGGVNYITVAFPSTLTHQSTLYNNNSQPPPPIQHRNWENDPRSGTRSGRTGSGSAADYDRQMNSCATNMTTLPEDDFQTSKNSGQTIWRSNYVSEAMMVTTTDLVSWAFQVARGMDYLSSRNVLHGDLATRNILLCENNVVKICDFGLSRTMYMDEYHKTGNSKLPVKWLALESLSSKIFSTYSDVWSFGVVLWEMFSLSKVPYPAINSNQELFNKLNDGYRMEKPQFANKVLHEIMLECWRKNPESRPLFNELEERFASMLGEDISSQYLELNEPYMQSNIEYRKVNPMDFLVEMGSPTEQAPAPPRFDSKVVVPEIRIDEPTDGYLPMSPGNGAEAKTAIFSPTRLEGEASDFPDLSSETTFNFPGARQSPTLSNNLNSASNKPLLKKNGLHMVDAEDQAPEEIPMLHRQSTGSDESPEQGRRFNHALHQQHGAPTPSPRHHVETKLNGESAEHYVNVKPPRKNIPSKTTTGGGGSGPPGPTEAFSNPGYQPLSIVNEKEPRRF
ncbi:vascular endothelial growth factor receptor 1 isoform X3 [Drosophila ficusphila]|uniref:vascular endothelial growth factor receptor 1 isoform X3 n=1 Tax=Drosophila ficusphila TaxID=30025 RepID=UPI001C8A0B0E|nr:vascular endothelial growth factor receptor 1 isoform X3 [Drosophila ficusphila]